VRRAVVPTEEAEYELPDGQQIKIGKPRSAAPEIMFQPQLFGAY
jgi:actin-related protein